MNKGEIKKEKIPVSQPDLSGDEEKNVIEAIQSTWISSQGKFVTQFENEFAEFCESSSAITVCNGTIALHLALLGLNVQPGDEVLVPALTYIATANAVRYVGAEPVFVDVDPNTWCIDPTKIENSITKQTKGIIAVHLYGHPADMDAINQIAEAHNLWVIEDAAEAHGAKYKGRKTGSLAKIATFSFYGNKLLTSGEGGAVTLNDEKLYSHLCMLRGQGMDPNRRYYFPITGYNFRLTNIACAILCAQLNKFEKTIQSRNIIYNLYKKYLSGIPGIEFQPIAEWAEVAPWLFCITVDASKYGHSRDELIQILTDNNIETRPFFIPMHKLPPFSKESAQRGEKLHVSELLGSTGLNLPTFTTLSSDQIKRVSYIIREYSR